jgi:GT2 family glycosyltransferase
MNNMTKPIELTACIVLYKNDPIVLLNAINSFLATQLNVHLYLIDNSPTADLETIISDSRLSYFHTPSNPGFGAAHNIAIKKAMDLSVKYHLVLNPDVYFEKGTLEKIINFMDQNQDIGNLMPKVLYPDGQIQYLCKLLPTPYDWIGRRFNPFKRLVNERNQLFELRFTEYERTMEVPYLSGCFMFLNLVAIEKIGLFDEGIFMYGEETDLCRRLIKAGYKTIFYPEIEIYHHFEKGSHKSLRLTWIGIKSAIYYFNKWGWFFDKERQKINRSILKKLNYND